MGVGHTGEEYCRRKGDVWDEPNSEPAIDNWEGGGATKTSLFAAITVQKRSSAQLSSVQLISVQFSSGQFSSSQFSSAQFISAQLSSVQFSSAEFSAPQLSSVKFSSSSL
jgi:uncharacterized protein YjbI with pentapeptide repeats